MGRGIINTFKQNLMNEITAAIKDKALEKFPEPANGFWTETQKFHVEKLREAYTCGGEDAIGFMLKFAKWFASDDNPYQKEYNSDDDNDGKFYDYFSEGINRHYFTIEQLLLKYMEETK